MVGRDQTWPADQASLSVGGPVAHTPSFFLSLVPSIFFLSFPQVNTIHLLLVSRTPDQPHLPAQRRQSIQESLSRMHSVKAQLHCYIAIDSGISISVQVEPFSKPEAG
jgi:hypothetical protein